MKVICVCALHVFFHQYVVDLRERRLENIFRTVSTSDSEQELEIGESLITDMTDRLGMSGNYGLAGCTPCLW